MSGEVAGWLAVKGSRVEELEFKATREEFARAAAIRRPLASVMEEPHAE